MKALLIRVGSDPVPLDLPDDQSEAFAAMKRTLGNAHLERIRLHDCDLYVDEDGVPKRLLFNRKGIVGDFIALAPHSDRLKGLSYSQAKRVEEIFKKEEA